MNSSCKFLQGALRAPYKVHGPTMALWERCLACWEIIIQARRQGQGRPSTPGPFVRTRKEVPSGLPVYRSGPTSSRLALHGTRAG